MRQISAKAVRAAQDAAHHCPDLHAAALTRAAAKGAKHSEEIAGDAFTLAAAFIPEKFRTGAEPVPAEDFQRIANGAAKAAVARALAQHNEDQRRAESLDALAENDPGAVETIAHQAATTGGALITPAAVDPARRYDANAADVRDAAILAATPDADPQQRRLLAESCAAYLDAVRAERDHRSGRLPSLSGAACHAAGIPSDSRTAKATAKKVRALIANAKPYAAAILAEPLDLTTPEARTLPTARRTVTRPAPLAAPLVTDEEPPTYVAEPGDVEHWTGRLYPVADQPGTVTTSHGTQDHTARENAAQARLRDRTAHVATWTQHRRPVATWTPQAIGEHGTTYDPASLAAQARAAVALAHQATRERVAAQEAKRPHGPASVVVAQVPARTFPEGWGYPADVAHTYDLPPFSTLARVRVLSSSREVLADRLASDWTPWHTARFLAETDQARAAALPLPERIDPTTGTTARPEQPENGTTAPQQANPTTGQVASQKAPAPRKANRAGTTGPTVPARLTRPRPVVAPAPVWTPAPAPLCPACGRDGGQARDGRHRAC